jgi:cell division septal protein FtsQ
VALERTTRAAVEAAIHPLAAKLAWPEAGRLLPSGRSIAWSLVVAGTAVLAYVGARTTSVFAVDRIEVVGLPAADSAAARVALDSLRGRSLVTLTRADLQGPLAGQPGVLSFDYDRAFPHTLIVFARSEVPDAVLRRGAESWLVSRRGRVLGLVRRGTRPSLPRIWVPGRAEVERGATLAEQEGGTAAWALALLQDLRFPAAARTVRTEGELTYQLRSGLELRLGSPRAARLKLAIAAHILPRLGADVDYLDVSVPDRPVAGPNSQLEG